MIRQCYIHNLWANKSWLVFWNLENVIVSNVYSNSNTQQLVCMHTQTHACIYAHTHNIHTCTHTHVRTQEHYRLDVYQIVSQMLRICILRRQLTTSHMSPCSTRSILVSPVNPILHPLLRIPQSHLGGYLIRLPMQLVFTHIPWLWQSLSWTMPQSKRSRVHVVPLHTDFQR